LRVQGPGVSIQRTDDRRQRAEVKKIRKSEIEKVRKDRKQSSGFRV